MAKKSKVKKQSKPKKISQNKQKKNMNIKIRHKTNLNLVKTKKNKEKGNNNSTENSMLKMKLISQITNDSTCSDDNDSSFCIYKSLLDNNIYITYFSKNESIISYNLIENTKIIEIKNIHEYGFACFSHISDKRNGRDLIISYDNIFLKLWDAKTWKCLHEYEDLGGEDGCMLSYACFFEYKNNIYIIMCFKDFDFYYENIKVYNLKGDLIKKINDSDDNTSFIDTYYDKNLHINFIISGNYGYSAAFNYEKNILYHKYETEEEKQKQEHGATNSVIIYEDNNEKINFIKLIECQKEYIRIWDFHKALLLNRIEFKCRINCLCLWDNKFLFAGCKDAKIRLIKLDEKKNNNQVMQEITEYTQEIICIKKIKHPKYGECIITQGLNNEQIKLFGTYI